MLQKLHTIMFVYQILLKKILRFAVSRRFFCGALKDITNSAREICGNEGNLGTSPKITKNHENLHFLCRAEYPHTSRSLTRPRYVLGTSSLHFRILQKILKRFKKKFMKIYWKFLIENRFQKCWFRKFSKNHDFSIFSIFRFFEKINGNPTFFDFSIFSKNSDFPIFRKFFMKILIFRKFSKSTFLKSIFDQKISIYFHDFFLNRFKIFWRIRKWRLEVRRT